MVMFDSFLYVYQRVNLHFPSFSYGFPTGRSENPWGITSPHEVPKYDGTNSAQRQWWRGGHHDHGQGDWRGENPLWLRFAMENAFFDRHIIINHHKSWMFMVHVKNRYANKNRG